MFRCLRVEAEYIALKSGDRNEGQVDSIAYLQEILAAITNDTGPELKIREDNQSCIKMTKKPDEPTVAPSTIDIKYHHIRDEVKAW
ncbi:hypothetical protein Pcac1_g28068 [Phytophthora cactorum]|nr:hypothetical protein Pcac1_g28068 [Phytophthora cactorum]